MRKSPMLVATGLPGLAAVLSGAAAGQVYFVRDDPGTSKTTLAMQFVLERGAFYESCIR